MVKSTYQYLQHLLLMKTQLITVISFCLNLAFVNAQSLQEYEFDGCEDATNQALLHISIDSMLYFGDHGDNNLPDIKDRNAVIDSILMSTYNIVSIRDQKYLYDHTVTCYNRTITSHLDSILNESFVIKLLSQTEEVLKEKNSP